MTISIDLTDYLRVVLVCLNGTHRRPISNPLDSCLRMLRRPYNLAKEWFQRIRCRGDAKFSDRAFHSDHNTLEEVMSSIHADTIRALDEQSQRLSEDTMTATELSSAESNQSSLRSCSSSASAGRKHRGRNRTSNCSDSNWGNGRGLHGLLHVRRKRCGTCGWQPSHTKDSERSKITNDDHKIADRCFHERFHYGRNGYRCFLCIGTMSCPKEGRSFDWMAKHVAKHHTFAEVCNGACHYTNCGGKLPWHAGRQGIFSGWVGQSAFRQSRE